MSLEDDPSKIGHKKREDAMNFKTKSSSSMVGWTAFAIVLAAVVSCGRAPEQARSPEPPAPKAETNDVYVRLECGACHGDNRQGSEGAPPLVDLAQRWDQASLVAFLKDPQGMGEANPHIAYREEPYPLQMPAFGGVEEAELEDLARFLLEH
jgi:mono/diheme cytochrome c family protein